MQRSFIFLLILTFTSFLQSTIFPFNLVLVLLLILAFLPTQTNQSLGLAFASGLILDFLSQTTLGISSLLFLLAVILVIFARKSGILSRLTSFLPLFFILFLGYESSLNLILNQNLSFNFWRAVFETFLSFLFYPLTAWFWKKLTPPEILQLSFEEKLK